MTITDLKEYYQEYDRAMQKVLEKAPVTAGLLGMGDSPKNAPCHEIFYEKVGAWAAEFAASQPTAGEAAEALSLILEAAARRRGQETYWYCYAAQGHGQPLIGLLTAQDAGDILRRYEADYPPIDRMPVQQRIVKELKKQAKPGTGLFGRRR